jgi:hypothetical protein
MKFLLRGPKGVVQFLLYTGWQLPHVQAEFDRKGYDSKPMAADLGYHSPVPFYEDQTPTTESCGYLGGKPCYYDGSGLQAEPVFERLLREGDAGVWAALEDFYANIFGEPWQAEVAIAKAEGTPHV